jgi:hypothetical protein
VYTEYFCEAVPFWEIVQELCNRGLNFSGFYEMCVSLGRANLRSFYWASQLRITLNLSGYPTNQELRLVEVQRIARWPASILQCINPYLGAAVATGGDG